MMTGEQVAVLASEADGDAFVMTVRLMTTEVIAVWVDRDASALVGRRGIFWSKDIFIPFDRTASGRLVGALSILRTEDFRELKDKTIIVGGSPIITKEARR